MMSELQIDGETICTIPKSEANKLKNNDWEFKDSETFRETKITGQPQFKGRCMAGMESHNKDTLNLTLFGKH